MSLICHGIVDVDVLGSVPNKPTVSLDVKQHFSHVMVYRAELCENGDGHPVPNKLLVPVDVKQYLTTKKKNVMVCNVSRIAQELCESGGDCPGLPVPNSP